MSSIDLLDGPPLRFSADAGGIVDVVDRVAPRLELNALEFAGQVAGRPLPGRYRLLSRRPGRGEHDESGQVVRLGTQTIKEPGAHAGPALDNRPRVHKGMSRIMVDLLGGHRADDTDAIGDSGDVREQVGDLLPRLAVAVELASWPARRQHHVLKLRELLTPGERFGEWLAVQLLEHRLVIKALELRRPARHAEVNHPPCLDRQVRWVDHPAPVIHWLSCVCLTGCR